MTWRDLWLRIRNPYRVFGISGGRIERVLDFSGNWFDARDVTQIMMKTEPRYKWDYAKHNTLMSLLNEQEKILV